MSKCSLTARFGSIIWVDQAKEGVKGIEGETRSTPSRRQISGFYQSNIAIKVGIQGESQGETVRASCLVMRLRAARVQSLLF
jgi:hypothetical protein